VSVEPFLVRRGSRPPCNHRRVLQRRVFVVTDRRGMARPAAQIRQLALTFSSVSVGRCGVPDVILEALVGSGVSDAILQMIDATIVRAQRARTFAPILDHDQCPHQHRRPGDRYQVRARPQPRRHSVSALLRLHRLRSRTNAGRQEIRQRSRPTDIELDKSVYALRNHVKRLFNRAKNSHCVATRCDKLIESFCGLRAPCVHSHPDQFFPHDWRAL
jgi:hypothetical protein